MRGKGDDTEGKAFGAMLGALRALHGMTLDEVAERSGLSKSHVWELEKGRGVDITIRSIRQIADCFGVPVTDFLLDRDETSQLHPEAMRIALRVDRAIRAAQQQGAGGDER